jgi:hypothetical protein
MEQPVGHNPDRISDAFLNTGLILLLLLGLIALGFGGPGVLWYFAILLFLGVAIAILAPRHRSARIARFVATLLTVLLLPVEWFSGLPRAVLDGLGPFAQYLHDAEGGLWLVLVLVIFAMIGVLGAAVVWSVVAWCSDQPHRVLLSALVMAVALFPLIGIADQEVSRLIVH